MKKLLYILTTAALFIACEGPQGPVGPKGQDGKDGKDGESANWYSTSITVHQNEWILNGNPGDLNSYFYAYKPLSQLTDYIYERGSVIAYIETEEGIKNGMPFVLHLGEQSGEYDFLWTQTYDFDFTSGEVGFYVTYSDFSTSIRPSTETFHIVMFWK